MTKEILDILDEEGIKATFFVTSGGEYVKRAYNSGHTIALHTLVINIVMCTLMKKITLMI